MTNKTIVESDQYCFRCRQPLAIGNEDRLCAGCDSRITGLPLSEPSFQREAAKLIWRLKGKMKMTTHEKRTLGSNQSEIQDQARSVLLRAICHLENGWVQGDYAQTEDGRATNPLAAEATAWCVDGACMLAQHETGASREAMRLVQKALTLTCSARKGTKIEPFRWANEVNDLPGITRFYMIAILRHAAEVVPLAHLVQGGTYPPGLAKKILKQAQEG